MSPAVARGDQLGRMVDMLEVGRHSVGFALWWRAHGHIAEEAAGESYVSTRHVGMGTELPNGDREGIGIGPPAGQSGDTSRENLLVPKCCRRHLGTPARVMSSMRSL